MPRPVHHSDKIILCIAAPYAGLKFFSYEAIKGTLGRVFGLSENELAAWQRMGAGLVAGMLAQTAVYPFDVIRRRMQTATSPLYTGTWNALTTIAKTEGIRGGLYRGLMLNYMKTMPNVAIYMSLYDVSSDGGCRATLHNTSSTFCDH